MAAGSTLVTVDYSVRASPELLREAIQVFFSFSCSFPFLLFKILKKGKKEEKMDMSGEILNNIAETQSYSAPNYT